MKKLKFEIESIEGIHIGVATDVYEKGAIDSTTIKDKDGKPYIPASSIKGKFRYFLDNITYFLTEEEIKDINNNFDVDLQKDINSDKLSIKFFGSYEEDNDFEFNTIKKILFKDAILTTNLETYEDLFEIKAENSIDIIGEEINSNPRIIERTIAGLKYEFEIIIIGMEKEDKIIELIKKVFDYISDYGYIGGNGTRGYGKVKINLIEEL